MKIGLAQLKTGENAFQFSSQADPWLKELTTRLADRGVQIPGNVEVWLQLTKLEPDYYLKGRMQFESEQLCARCAEIFPLPITHSFELGMAHVSTPSASEKLAEESEELDIQYFEGPELDFDPILEEQILLSLPYKAVCRADCKGICQSCGANLNESTCGCPKSNTVHAFAALSQLKH